MVDFSVKSTSLSAPDLGAASHVSQGIANDSSAMGIQNNTNLFKGLADIGMDVYKSNQLSDLNKEDQAAIQEYMNRRENPAIAQDSLVDMAGQDVQTSVFKPTGEALSNVERAQKDRLNTYKQALDEGVMTPDEFQTRVLANLREATNRNPGMFQELKAEAARVLELSGITGILKSDQLIAESKQKQAEDLIKDLQKRMVSEHLFYDPYDTSPKAIISMKEQLQRAEGDTRMFNMQVRNKDRIAMLSTEQSKTFFQEHGLSMVRGGISNADKVVTEMIDTLGITSENYSKYKGQVTGTLDAMKREFRASVPVSIMQEPITQQMLKDFDAGIDSIAKRFDDTTSGEDMKKRLANEVAIAKGMQDKSLYDTYDVSRLELTSNLLKSAPQALIGEDTINAYKSVVSSIAGENFNAPVLKKLIPQSDKDKFSSDVLTSSINWGLKSGDHTGTKRTLDALNTQTQAISNPKTRLQYLYNNVSVLAKQKPMDVDVEVIQKTETMIGQLINDQHFGIGTLKEVSVGKNVSIDMLANGQLVFTGEDANKFNATYANNINTALRAYANVHNTTMAKAAERFYPQYLGGIVKPNLSNKSGK